MILPNNPEAELPASEVIDIAALEREKLQLEISELRHWWRRSGFLGPIATVAITAIAVVTAIYVGYFDKARLDLERSQLSAQIATLQTEKGSLEGQIDDLKERETVLRDSVGAISAEKMQDEADLRLLKDNLREFQKANEGFAKHSAVEQQEIAAAHQSVRAKEQEKALLERANSDLKEKLRLAKNQLAMYPPIVKHTTLISYNHDAWIEGDVQGVNLGDTPGIVTLRVVRVKPSGLHPSRLSTAVTSKGSKVLDTEVIAIIPLAADSIKSWEPTSIRFQLSPGERSRIEQAKKTLSVSAGDTLSLGRDGFCQLKVETGDGGMTDWTDTGFGAGVGFGSHPVQSGN